MNAAGFAANYATTLSSGSRAKLLFSASIFSAGAEKNRNMGTTLLIIIVMRVIDGGDG
jgi:hypothetical protein